MKNLKHPGPAEAHRCNSVLCVCARVAKLVLKLIVCSYVKGILCFVGGLVVSLRCKILILALARTVWGFFFFHPFSYLVLQLCTCPVFCLNGHLNKKLFLFCDLGGSL